MEATCATCKNWNLRDGAGNRLAIAKEHMGRCAIGPAWKYLPPHQTCKRHQAAPADVVEKRIVWLEKGRG